MYEEYTHYVPGDSARLKYFAVEVVTGYCNLCDAVIAPSASVARLLDQRGVEVPVEVIPTGVDLEIFRPGDASAFRRRLGIPPDAFVIGHAGRLAPEKNIILLVEVLTRVLTSDGSAHVLIAGDGPLRADVIAAFGRHGMWRRLHMTGSLGWDELCQAYRAMDVFAFASHTETQGMVIAEALASGLPVVAVDASGVREVVRDGVNGFLLPDEDRTAFVRALSALGSDRDLRRSMSAGARRSVEHLSKQRMAARTLELYDDCIARGAATRPLGGSTWSMARRRFAEELKIIRNIVHAAGDAVIFGPSHDARHVQVL
jgi:glycosyltransferase involved in cell wall biosynthesis